VTLLTIRWSPLEDRRKSAKAFDIVVPPAAPLPGAPKSCGKGTSDSLFGQGL